MNIDTKLSEFITRTSVNPGMNIDTKLSEFITRTSADPGLARDLLEGHGWDLKNAINAFYIMDGTLSEGEAESTKDEDESDLFNTETSRPTIFKSFRLPSSHCVISAINAKCSSEPSLASPSPRSAFLGEKMEGETSTTSSPSKLAVSRTSSPSKLAVSGIEKKKKNGGLVEDAYPQKLSRGISRATDNVNLVSKARNELAHDFQLSSRGSRLLFLDKDPSLVDAPEYTFTLPDLSIHSPDFSDFLEKDLIEKSSLVSLEGANRLNWWFNQKICQRLLPLATTGDGNCLLHAASLGMWGFHDRLLTLRKALHTILGSTKYSESFYRRWRYQTSISNEAAGLTLCEQEWEKEWKSLLKMSSSEPRVRGNKIAPSPDSSATKSALLSGGKKARDSSNGFGFESNLYEFESNVYEFESNVYESESNVYESLEEIHILALAHVLMRPIIVIADTVLKDVTGEPFAPIPFGGIYLPVEIDPVICYKSPLCLTYDAAHFSALVAIDQESFADKTPTLPTAIPLVDSENKLLPVQFITDPGPNVSWKDPGPNGSWRDSGSNGSWKDSGPNGSWRDSGSNGCNGSWKETSNQADLSQEAKIALLRRYLDVVDVKNPKASTKPSGIQDSTEKESADEKKESADEKKGTPAEHEKSKEEKVESKEEEKVESKEEEKVESKEGSQRERERWMTLPSQLDESGVSSGTGRCTCSCPAEPSPPKTSRSKGGDQWRMIRHRLGSFGRSFKRRFKRSYTSLSKRGSSFRKSWRKAVGKKRPETECSKIVPSSSSSSHHGNIAPPSNDSSTILCATLNTDKRHDYHEEMIRNYLITARIRFLNHQKETKKKSTLSTSNSVSSPTQSSSSSSSSHQSETNKKDQDRSEEIDGHFASQCVNSGCDSFGTSETSYLCFKCFQEQKQEMNCLKSTELVDEPIKKESILVDEPIKKESTQSVDEPIKKESNEQKHFGDEKQEDQDLAQIEKKKLGSSENLIPSSYTSPGLKC